MQKKLLQMCMFLSKSGMIKPRQDEYLGCARIKIPENIVGRSSRRVAGEGKASIAYVPKLSFIENKRMWAGHIRGKAMREIPKGDFETVLEVAGVRGV